MNKDMNELNDETLDSVIGGTGTYASDLSDFMITKNDKKYITYAFGNSQDCLSSVTIPVSDAGFQRIVERANKYGGVTLTNVDGSTQYFTHEQLSAML